MKQEQGKKITVFLTNDEQLVFHNAKMRYWEPSDTYGFRNATTDRFLGLVPKNQIKYIIGDCSHERKEI